MKFKKFLTYTLEKLRSLCKYENNRRDSFIRRNGLYMPKDLIPELSHKAPFLKLIPKELNKELNCDEILTENDKKINNIDSNIYYFQKVFSDILKQVDIKPSDENVDSNLQMMYEDKIKQLNDQHEDLITNTLDTYKQEVNRLMSYGNNLEQKVQQMNDQIDTKDKNIHKLENNNLELKQAILGQDTEFTQSKEKVKIEI